MKNGFRAIVLICAFSTAAFGKSLDGQVINHELAARIEELKEADGYSSENFNACQITWAIKQLDQNDPDSKFPPHTITFQYENHPILDLISNRGGDPESIQGLGLNCLEYNNYIYLFFDTLSDETRAQFGLDDLAYVTYSSDRGHTWSKLTGLHFFSVKGQFVLPHQKFRKYVKIFGNKDTHALSIFNLRDETTYLFDPEFQILKTVPVYNRLSDYDNPVDFSLFRNILYLVRGSCDLVRGNIQCPPKTYLETSRNFGLTWKRETLPFLTKSYFLTLDHTLYHFYFRPCGRLWVNPIPALDWSQVCGLLQVRQLNILGTWERPKTLLTTVDDLIGIYPDTKPLLVWKDFRFHKSRPCGYIPLIGCMDDTPFRGPDVIYAGLLDIKTMSIEESIIRYRI